MVLPFYTPTSNTQDLVSHILATTLYGHYFFYSSCFAKCIVISHCGLICISVIANGIKHLIFHPYISCSEMSLHAFAHFLIGLFIFFC